MAPEESDEIQSRGTLDFLKDPWGILLRRWPWMLATLLLALGATAAAIGSMKLRYEAKSTILVTAQQIPEEFVKPTIAENPFQTINAMVGSILSRETIVALVEKHDLYPDMRETHTLDAIVSRVREDITVGAEQGIGTQSRVESARLYAITVEADTPQHAAGLANDLASRFIDANIRVRTQQARLATEFLQRELVEAERDLLAQNKRIQDFKREHRGELPSELAANLAAISLEALTCVFDVPEPPPGDPPVDLSKVNVKHEPVGGGETNIPQDYSLPCSDPNNNGWQWFHRLTTRSE
jgi:succinoglycan biosynthesis transport protein ExoP